MGLSDPHVKKTVRELLCKPGKPRAVGHGRRDCHDPWILLCQLAELFRKNIRITRELLFFLRLPRFNIKGVHSMEPGGVLLRRAVALSLGGHHMDQDRMADPLGLL